jgi:hypothetical protein
MLIPCESASAEGGTRDSHRGRRGTHPLSALFPMHTLASSDGAFVSTAPWTRIEIAVDAHALDRAAILVLVGSLWITAVHVMIALILR